VTTVALVLFAAGPAWLAPRRGDGTEHLFYDGACGLCHRTVRLAVTAAPDDDRLLFAPLDSPLFAERVPADLPIPDSLVYVTSNGDVLLRTAAVIRLLDRLGGKWRGAALLLRATPRPLRDCGYAVVARIRHRLFARPTASRPAVPEHLRARFVS